MLRLLNGLSSGSTVDDGCMGHGSWCITDQGGQIDFSWQVEVLSLDMGN